jgi:hypothetical protein
MGDAVLLELFNRWIDIIAFVFCLADLDPALRAGTSRLMQKDYF